MPATLIGKEHNAHLDWLLNVWMKSDSPVCFLEGFSGTGKTIIARELLTQATNSKITAVMITAPETNVDPTDDILLDLAMELNSAGRTELADAIENNRPLVDVLSTLVNDPILIIIDEFQRSMQGDRAITRGGFAKVLSTLANRKWLKGRILLLSNRLIERARWSEPYTIRTLKGMSTNDGVVLLEHFANEVNRSDEIPISRRRDIVNWLGGNPRAIQLLIKTLAYESLDDLIGVQPELWEMRDREVSPELIEELERNILEKTLMQLSDEYRIALYRLSVYRKPFKRQAIENLFTDRAKYAQFKAEMINRFLMEQYKGWFNLHPIVREIGLQKLSSEQSRQAHNLVSAYYTRHFQAKQIVGWGALGGYFVEVRYHLTKAGQEDKLKPIALRFQNYIFYTLSQSQFLPIPKSAEELDERIAVLSALLETPGPRLLEYHLARLFYTRNQRNDLRRALHHIHRAKLKSDRAEYWLLCSEILQKMGNNYEAIGVLKESMNYIPTGNLVAVYYRIAQLLVEKNDITAAINILKQGIERIPLDKSVASLYVLLADILPINELIVILQKGIESIPPDKALVTLYDKLARLLFKEGKTSESINVLKKGINNIPVDKAVVSLYDLLARILAHINRKNEAIDILKLGIKRIPPDKALFILYHYYSELLGSEKKYEEAIEILLEGIRKIPPSKGIIHLYLSYINYMFYTKEWHDATILIENGLNRLENHPTVNSLRLQYAKLLMATNQNEKATEILWKGINDTFKNTDQLVETVIMFYAGLFDTTGLEKFDKLKDNINRQFIILAQTLLYQIQGKWADAAEHAYKSRQSGIYYPTLIIMEAFSWFCTNKLELALETLSITRNNLDKHSNSNLLDWLQKFILLKMREANIKSNISDSESHLQNIDIDTLLTMWSRPSSSLKEWDFAYYFPALPPEITGLPQLIKRRVYQEIVFNNYLPLTDNRGQKKMEEQKSRTKVFISYSHKNKEWLEQLKTHLATYIANNKINVWDDTMIEMGADWRSEIERALAETKVAILLVTPEFLGSQFIRDNELPPLLNAAKEDGVTIAWISISASAYMQTEIKHYQAANDPAKPLDTLTKPKRNEVFVQICQKILKALG